VRSRFSAIRNLGGLSPTARGWTVEVLGVLRSLGTRDFELADLYRFESYFSVLYPKNQHLKQKLRQQLQVLRDLGFVRFNGHGQYSLKEGLGESHGC